MEQKVQKGKTSRFEFNWKKMSGIDIKNNLKFVKYMKTKKYLVSFIEEGIFNPEYKDYVGGRVEVYAPDKQYDIEEIRFLTKRKDWYDYREKWDLKEVTEKQLTELRRTIEEKYRGGEKVVVAG